MIRSYEKKWLKELFASGKNSRIRQDLVSRCIEILDALHRAKTLSELNIPGLRLHPSKTKPVRWRVDVNGPWRITFEFKDGDAYKVDLVQDH